MILTSYAKINLTLEVLGKRDDGYHDIASVLQNISLADTLTIDPAEKLELRCNDPALETSDNLVLKAARMLAESTGCRKGATLRLSKNAPPASGLGAGSSNAAATLIGLNEFWGLGLSRQYLVALSLKLGSDTTFFLYGGTALAQGRGERVTPLPPMAQVWLVLLMPQLESIPNKTARLYGQLKEANFTGGQYTGEVAKTLESGKTIDDKMLFNTFEQVALDFFPRLAWYRERLLAAGAPSVHLAGSGPTLFAVAPGKEEGGKIAGQLVREGLNARLVSTVSTSVVIDLY